MNSLIGKTFVEPAFLNSDTVPGEVLAIISFVRSGRGVGENCYIVLTSSGKLALRRAPYCKAILHQQEAKNASG